jgi:hypothetical protein
LGQARSEWDRGVAKIALGGTSGGINKLEIYKKLRVREVWLHRRERVKVYALRAGSCAPIEKSEVPAGVDLEELPRFAGVGPMTRAVREYRDAPRAG